LRQGMASPKGVTFRNGTIEFDVQPFVMGAGLAFRRKDDSTFEYFVGWVREVWVFVNGKLVYSDKNLYMPATARKAPDGRCSVENGSFQLPLNPGNNQIAIAVASNFYGLAVVLRPDDITGLQLARK